MEASVGVQPVTKPLELGRPCVTGACGCVPTAAGRQCLLELPPRLELLWGITESAFPASGVPARRLRARGDESLLPRAPGELVGVFAPRAKTQIAQLS